MRTTSKINYPLINKSVRKARSFPLTGQPSRRIPKYLLRRLQSNHSIIFLSFAVLFFSALFVLLIGSNSNGNTGIKESKFWRFQAVDTMKYSRDLSREKLFDPTFNVIIDRQVKQIAYIGATHVAIATPYDEEFVPFLRLWVSAARRYKIKVWFRGNWSGWEGWFDYPKIDREEHILKTRQFIMLNRDIFEDGDIFSACPECENGGSGDPRRTGDVEGYRKFLIDEYRTTKKSFLEIGKDVESNYDSMNGDVARLIMDKKTTKELDGLVVVDHYVGTPEKLALDVVDFSERSGGKVILGEFGIPIPDINGAMTEDEQYAWLSNALQRLSTLHSLAGVSYWTNVGSSTELWNFEGKERKAAGILKKYFSPNQFKGYVSDEIGNPIKGAEIAIDYYTYFTSDNGYFSIPYVERFKNYEVVAPGYERYASGEISESMNNIVLKKQNESGFFKLRKIIYKFLKT